MESVIVGVLSVLGTTGLVLFVVLKYYNTVRTIIKDIVSTLAASIGWFKSTTTKLSIETNGTKAIEKLNRTVPELDLPELSIEWVKSDDDGKIRLEPGKAIVLLKYNKDNTQNIINTTAAYVHKTLLQNSKPYMDKGIHTAIDFSIIREFLNSTPQKNYIVTQYVESCSDVIDSYEDYFDKVVKIEDEGLLTRVLIREYAIWGNKLAGKISTKENVLESKHFLDFIFNIATREFDELTPLVYNNGSIKVAILLVAKYDTYAEKGIEPYVRRIREGFANGINTFYLLARNEKIDILNQVYGQIISSGNYNLLNGPEVYKDNVGRDNICYCIEVKSDADLAKSYAYIKECIDDEKTIEAIVTKVFKDTIKCEYDGITFIIPRKEITDSLDLRLKNYYTSGMAIEVIPQKVIDKGEVLCSILGTKSDPKGLFNNQYEVGSVVSAIVEGAEDDFINLRISDSTQQCVAYRRDLTYSRFDYLHILFPVGKVCNFVIKDIDYIYNKLILSFPEKVNPWEKFTLKQDDKVEFEVLNIKETCIETELDGGLFAILPYSELSWLESTIEEKKHSIKRLSKLSGRIKKIITKDNLIILTCKENISPYETYFESVKDTDAINMIVDSQNAYGILGTVANKYKIFVPNGEAFFDSKRYKIKNGSYRKVKVLKIDDRKSSLIGTFKPFIKHPLSIFLKEFHEGQVLSHLKYLRSTNYGAYFEITYANTKHSEALLLNKEVSNWCYINNLDMIFDKGFSCPLVLKEINLKKNVILLSLKELTKQNVSRVETIKLGDERSGIVLGSNYNKYSVLLVNMWIEIPVESEKRLKNGEMIKVTKASSSIFVASDN